jgi:hypothetical protein
MPSSTTTRSGSGRLGVVQILVVLALTALPLAAQQITSVIPDHGPAAGGFEVTILGTGLGSGSDIHTVTLNGVAAEILDQGVDGTSVTVVAADAGTAVGRGDVQVVSDSQGTSLLPQGFVYNTVHYVSPSGDDQAGTGHLESPWATLGAALAHPGVFDHDTIRLLEGTYDEDPLTVGRSILIHGDAAHTTVVRLNTSVPLGRAGTGSPLITVSNGSQVQIAGLCLTQGNAVSGGGAILNQGDLSVSKVWFLENRAGGFGGAVLNSGGGVLSVRACTFERNSAGVDGGALASVSANGEPNPVTLENTTFYENSSAGSGAAVFHNTPGELRVEHCTVFRNRLSGDVGNGAVTVADGTLTVSDTLIAANTGPTMTAQLAGPDTAIADGGHNLVESQSGTALTDANANQLGPCPALALGPPAWYGGAVPTCPLYDGSPAIDAADETGSLLADARGYTYRGLPDIGAFERNGLSPFTVGQGQSYATIQDAVDAASSGRGEVVHVFPGTYAENIVLYHQVSVVAENGPDQTTIAAASPTEPIVDILHSNTVLDGFTVVGPTDPDVPAVSLVEASLSTVRGNRIGLDSNQSAHTGLMIGGGQQNLIIDNEIAWNQKGVLLDGAMENALVGNRVQDNTGTAMEMASSTGNSVSHSLLNGLAGTHALALADTGVSDNLFFLNHFSATESLFLMPGTTANSWQTRAGVYYRFGDGDWHVGPLGNHYSDYSTVVSTGTPGPHGIMDTPYPVDATQSDAAPLSDPLGAYTPQVHWLAPGNLMHRSVPPTEMVGHPLPAYSHSVWVSTSPVFQTVTFRDQATDLWQIQLWFRTPVAKSGLSVEIGKITLSGQFTAFSVPQPIPSAATSPSLLTMGPMVGTLDPGDHLAVRLRNETGEGQELLTGGTWSTLSTPRTAPVVETGTYAYAGADYIDLSGNVLDTGGNPILEQGACWSTLPGPTVAGPSATADPTRGSFTVTAKPLSPATLYYVRAYATNSGGTAYGKDLEVMTRPAAPTNLQATDGQSTGPVELSWDPVPEADSYRVYRDTGSDPTYATHVSNGADPQTPGFVDAGASANQVYHYWVTAWSDTAGESDKSVPDTGSRLQAHYNVRSDGSDADPGTPEQPFASLTHAISQCLPGDDVCVHGTLYEAGVLVDRSVVLHGVDAWSSALEAPVARSAPDYGGLLHVPDGVQLDLLDLTLRNGTANLEGGAVFNEGILNMRRCHVSGCTSGGTGGGVANRGSLTIEACAFTGNTAQQTGGALDNGGYGSLTLKRSTVAENAAEIGGGGLACRESGYCNLEFTTVAGNQAGTNGSGGGILVDSGTVSIEATLIAGNSAGSAPDANGSLMFYGYNVVSDSSGVSGTATATDLLDVDPMPASPADNGGPTPTCALAEASPARDLVPRQQAPLLDQRGFARSGEADSGAFEFNGVQDAGNCLVFDGTYHVVIAQGGYRSVNTVPAPSDQFTLEAWVFPVTSSTTTVLSRTSDGPGDVTLNLDGFSAVATDGATAFSGTILPPPLDQWTHVALVYDGLADPPMVQTYRNGRAFAPDSLTVSGGSVDITPAPDWLVGAIAGVPTQTFEGRMDEVRIWNRALSADEIKRTLHRHPRGQDSGLFTYLRLDQSEGQWIPDYSANRFQGDLTITPDPPTAPWTGSFAPIPDWKTQTREDLTAVWLGQPYAGSRGLSASCQDTSEFVFAFGHNRGQGVTTEGVPGPGYTRQGRVWSGWVKGTPTADLVFDLVEGAAPDPPLRTSTNAAKYATLVRTSSSTGFVVSARGDAVADSTVRFNAYAPASQELTVGLENSPPPAPSLEAPVHCPDANANNDPWDDDFAQFGRTLNPRPVFEWSLGPDADGDPLHVEFFCDGVPPTAPLASTRDAGQRGSFSFFDGTQWLAFPETGVTVASEGTPVRFHPSVDLPVGGHFWKTAALDPVADPVESGVRRLVVGGRDWTDPELTPAVSRLRKVYLDELREETDFARISRSLSPVQWTDPVITANVTRIRALYFTELRSALEETAARAGLPAPVWSEDLVPHATPVRTQHIDELRQALQGI